MELHVCYLEFLILGDDRNDDESGGRVVRLSELLLGGSLKTASLPTIVSRGCHPTQAAHVTKMPPPPQWANLGLQADKLNQKCCFLSGNNNFGGIIQKNGSIVMVYPQFNFLLLTGLQGGLLGCRQSPFLAQNSASFYATPI